MAKQKEQSEKDVIRTQKIRNFILDIGDSFIDEPLSILKFDKSLKKKVDECDFKNFNLSVDFTDKGSSMMCTIIVKIDNRKVKTIKNIKL